MNRREFISIAGIGMCGGLRLPRCEEILEHGLPVAPPVKAHGSGHFGEWMTDKYGLPAYRYTCNQLIDPLAVSPTNKAWRGARDHSHQVGNNRVVAVASNYGYVQVRQDEGAPKFLNDYAPEHNRYGAGIGYLTDGTTTLSTYYTGHAESFERIFGEGYYRKIVKAGGYEAEQTIFAPHGDDPVLISMIKITNRGSDAVRARWVEYWNSHHYPFTCRPDLEVWQLSLMHEAQDDQDLKSGLKHDFDERFKHSFRVVANGKGLLDTQNFMGRSAEDERAWARLEAAGRAPRLAAGTAIDDLNPPDTFLISLDAPMDGFATDAAAFFGSGGVENPSGLQERLKNDAGSTGPASAHLVERSFTLQPNRTRTIAFLYGYLLQGFELNALIAKYSGNPEETLLRSSERWKAEGLHFSTPEEPWVEREISWHNYYLRSALTWDSFFREHILTQGGNYLYVWGMQASPDDPVQHSFPFNFSDPAIVRGIIRYTLKEIQPDGSIPYGLLGRGVPTPTEFVPSHLELYVLWMVSEYVLATRDTAFLKEKIPIYPRQQVQADDPAVAEQTMRVYRHLVDTLGVGEHGLIRLLSDDWDDGMTADMELSPELGREVEQKGESAENAAMACYVLDHYGQMLSYAGESEAAADARAKAEAQRQALRAQWTGRWFRRAWLGPRLGWLGDEQLWLEPQPWAILGGATTSKQAVILVKAMDELLRAPSPIGALIKSRGNPYPHKPIGTWENGGVWQSINGPLIWALANIDGAMAWDEWKKNTLACHAEAYPNLWYGIWSGPDYYNSVLSKQHPGETYADFPVMNMHSHAWPLYGAAKLLGLEFHERGLRLQPQLPLESYEFRSLLLGLQKSQSGYSGWYNPLAAGRWEIEIRLPEHELAQIKEVRVNGQLQKLPRGTDPVRFEFEGDSMPGEPLRWKIIWSSSTSE